MAMVSLEPAPALEVFYEHREDPLPLQHNKHLVANDTIHRGWNSVSGVPLNLEFSEGTDSDLVRKMAR